MPKVRRKNVPWALIEHLALRVRERAVPIEDLQNLAGSSGWDQCAPQVSGINLANVGMTLAYRCNATSRLPARTWEELIRVISR